MRKLGSGQAHGRQPSDPTEAPDHTCGAPAARVTRARPQQELRRSESHAPAAQGSRQGSVHVSSKQTETRGAHLMSAGPRPSRPPAAHSTGHSGDMKVVLRNLVRPRCSSKAHTACRCEEDTMPTVSAMPCGAGGAHELVPVWLRRVRCHLPPMPPTGPTKAGRGAYPRPQGRAPHCGHQVRMKPGHSCRQSRGQDQAAPAPGAPFTSAVLGTVRVAQPGCGGRKGQAPRVARPVLGTQGPRGCEGSRPTSRWLLDWWDSSRRSARCLLTSSWSVVSLRISPKTWKRKVWEEEAWSRRWAGSRTRGSRPHCVKDAGEHPPAAVPTACVRLGEARGVTAAPPPHLVCFPAGPGGLSLGPELRIIHSHLGSGAGGCLNSHVLRHSQSLVGVSETTKDTLGSITQD